MNINTLIDPYGHGIPRRVVVLPDTGLICDKTRAPTVPEISSLSEVFHTLFQTEPRDAETLLRRCVIDDVSTAWMALRDDLVMGYSFLVPDELVSHFVKLLDSRPGPVQTFACLKLIPKHARTEATLLHACTLKDAHVLEVCRDMDIDIHTVARLLVTHPETSVAFITHPRLLDVHRLQPMVCRVLCDYASTAHDKYPPLSIVAQLVHAGIAPPKDHPVGLDTLQKLRKGKFNVKLAAAAAVLCQHHTDPVVRNLSAVIETLSATIQRVHTQ
jgi:hypothetical protein